MSQSNITVTILATGPSEEDVLALSRLGMDVYPDTITPVPGFPLPAPYVKHVASSTAGLAAIAWR